MTDVVPRNIALEGALVSHRKERFGVGTPAKICIANFGQTVTDSGMVTIDSL